MAGAAQSIGWILQVDDRVSGALDKISTKAVEVGKAIAESVKIDLTPSFEQMHVRFSDMTEVMRDFFSVETVEDIVDMLRPLFVDVKDTIERMEPVIQQVIQTTEQVSNVFGPGRIAAFNQWVLNVGFLLKTLQVAVWRPIKWLIGLPFRAARGLIATAVGAAKVISGTITGATGGVLKLLGLVLKPVTMVIDFLSKGVGVVLGPFGKLITDILSAVQFALQPLFMRFRFLILPFIQVMFPLFVDLIEHIWKEYIGPFVTATMPAIRKFVQWLIGTAAAFFDDPSEGWKKLKSDLMGFWDTDLKPIFMGFLSWAMGEGVAIAGTAWDAWVRWVQADLYPAMGEWVGELWNWLKREGPIWWQEWVYWVQEVLYPWMGETIGVAWDFLKKQATKMSVALALWVTNDLPKLLQKAWKAIKDGMLGIVDWAKGIPGLASLLGIKEPAAGDIGGIQSVPLAGMAAGLKRKEAAGTLTGRDRMILENLRQQGIQGLQGGGLVEGGPAGQMAIIGEGGMTEGVIPFGRDVPREEAIRMMQAATVAASLARGGEAPAAGADQQTLSLLRSMLEHLAMIAENTESSDWMNDPDFETSRRRSPWQT